MSQPEFILNFRWRKPNRLFQAADITAEHPEIRKTTYSNLGGFRFGHSVGTGRIDGRKLDIRSPQVTSFVFRVPATADGIKSVLRRLRPQEAELLDGIDRQIEELHAQLSALKEERSQALHLAWRHGNVVRLKEVEALLAPTDAKDA
ncbi:MAG TPA: hypothetical protein VK009_27630 [Chloroflexota bacterium]|nr:hypothetical protein [Chloroflexota bacterium]